MNIIKATKTDLDTVMNIRIEMLKVVNSLPENTSFDRELIDNTKSYFQKSCQTTVLAIEDKEAVGCGTICYVDIMPTWDHPTGKRAHIMNVYVRSEHRKKGIAFKMMERLIEEAKQKGVTEISLDATESGRPLYKKCGFVSTKEGMVLHIEAAKIERAP